MRILSTCLTVLGLCLLASAPAGAAGNDPAPSGDLVPGGWLQAPPPRPPAPPPPAPVDPGLAGPGPAPAVAPPPPPRRHVTRPAVHHPAAPAQGAPPSDGRVQF